VLRAFLAGGVLLMASACGGGAATNAPASNPPAASQAAAAITCEGSPGLPVAAANTTFMPASINVAVGGTVTWANGDQAPHTVTFDSGPDCGQMTTGQTITATFGVAGEYPYICTIHPSMRGTVVVQ
jgi:plastocyanin